MRKRVDDWLTLQQGRLVPQRREWQHSSGWQSEWRWLGRGFLKREGRR